MKPFITVKSVKAHTSAKTSFEPNFLVSAKKLVDKNEKA